MAISGCISELCDASKQANLETGCLAAEKRSPLQE